MASQQSLAEAWLQDLRQHVDENVQDDPNYWVSSPEILMTTAKPSIFNIGTGDQVLSHAFSKCASANFEVIIVTCFWAQSSSQEALASLLHTLSAKGVSQNRRIQVRICFSSSSIIQKLAQTSSLDGKIYPPSCWADLGLPPPETLLGLEMIIKSVFVLPFSVMHPKFILVDRKLAFMASCNVSWENWFEGCLEMKGEITYKLFEFWSAFWSRGEATLPPLPDSNEEVASSDESNMSDTTPIQSTPFLPKVEKIQTILLPSPHHINPRFQPLPFSNSEPPPTPLNLFILRLFSHAKQNIYIQTPNLTSQPLTNALFSALERGVNIHLVTSSALMILEQLGTAGTITEFEVWKLVRRYRHLLQHYSKSLRTLDPENLMKQPGVLRIGYYHLMEGITDESEPVKSHLKCVIMDDEVTKSRSLEAETWIEPAGIQVRSWVSLCFRKSLRPT